MKGKKPTVRQGKLMLERGMNWEEWLTQKDTPELLQVVHRDTKEVVVLKK